MHMEGKAKDKILEKEKEKDQPQGKKDKKKEKDKLLFEAKKALQLVSHKAMHGIEFLLIFTFLQSKFCEQTLPGADEHLQAARLKKEEDEKERDQRLQKMEQFDQQREEERATKKKAKQEAKEEKERRAKVTCSKVFTI